MVKFLLPSSIEKALFIGFSLLVESSRLLVQSIYQEFHSDILQFDSYILSVLVRSNLTSLLLLYVL